MSDSLITPDEEVLLDLIQQAQDSTAVPSKTPSTLGYKLNPPLNQEGRWRMIYHYMTLGNSLYGFGVPYLLKSDNPFTYIGFQLVAAGGGFYLSYNHTKDIDISLGRVSFNEMGSFLGMASFLPVHAAVGVRNWNDFDPHYRGALAYIMAATPIGMIQGNKLFERWKPTDGQATFIRNTAGFGLANGVASYFLLAGNSEPDTEFWVNNSYRALTLLGLGGALGGLHYGHEFVGGKAYTTGDALMIREAWSLGGYITMRFLTTAKIESTRLNVLLGMAMVDGFFVWGNHLVTSVDFTEGDAVIVAMGTLAANGIWRGVNLMAGGDMNPEAAAAFDIATSFIGFYTTFKSVKARRVELGYPIHKEQKIRFRSRPTILGNFHEPIPGMSFELNF